MNTFPLSRPLTLDEFVKGYADGGEVESIMPTGEDEFLFESPAGPEDTVENLAQKYDIPASNIFVEGFTPPTGFKMGEGDPQAAQRLMASLSLIDPSALEGLMATSFADPNAGAAAQYRADTRAGIGGAGSMYEEGALEAAKASAADPTKGIWEQGFQQLLAEDPEGTRASIEAAKERNLGALAKIEEEYSVMKPLSDMLKANKFQDAFAFAKEKGVVDKLMDTNVLRELRPAFNQQEMRDFFAAVPPDWAGRKFDFKPDIGVFESMANPGGQTLMESAYPDPTRAFKRKDDKTVENLAMIAAVAMIAAGVAPLFSGAGAASGAGAGAGAGAAGGASAAGAGAASTGSGFLTGLKTAAKTVLNIPKVIGETVASGLGYTGIEPVTAKMIGNAVISGGVTGAKGGDLEDVLKSAALAAGLTYVSDKAISAVAQKLQDSRLMDAVQEIPGGDVSAVSPTAAANIASNVSQGLENFAGEFAVTTFAPSAAAAGLANVGALTAAQAAVSPDQAAATEQVAPEDQIAGEFTVETTAPDFGAGLETGAYTGYKLASDQGVEEPAVTEQTEVVEEPVEEIKVSTEADQVDFSDPFIQSLIDQYTPEVTQPVEPVAEAPLEEIKVSTEADQLDFSDPFLQSLIDKYTPQPASPDDLFETTVSTEADKLTPSDASDLAIQTIMDRFEAAPVNPETGLQEIPVSTEKFDLTDPLTQVLVNRFSDVKPPEPVTDDLEEFKVETDRDLNQGFLEYAPPIFTPVDPTQIAKDYEPVGVEEDRFKKLLSKYGTLENLIKAAGLISGTSKTAAPPAAVAPYDPRTSAGAGQWIDWDKVKAEADAAGMNLNTYTARNWNKIQNRALEAGAPAAVAPVTPQGYNLPGVGGEEMMVNPQSNQTNFDLLKYLEEYQPEPLAFGGMAKGSGVRGPGHGREDLIPALLSDGEYVIDAETMALLGNGSTDAGAKMMDGFRENIRKHKGAKLARGGISPNAKSPLQYLRGA